jgi:hypothetical protein
MPWHAKIVADATGSIPFYFMMPGHLALLLTIGAFPQIVVASVSQ